MDVRQLRYFLALAEELHFGAAAKREFVGQSTLSEQIGRLEHELGIQLFERTSRKVRLSAAGEAILPHVRDAFWSINSAKDLARHIRMGTRGRLRVVQELGTECLDGFDPVRRFREVFPNVSVKVVYRGGAGVAKAVAQDMASAGIMWLPPQGLDDLRTVRLASLPFAVAMAEGHDLAAHSVIRVADLKGYPLVVADCDAGAWSRHPIAVGMSMIEPAFEAELVDVGGSVAAVFQFVRSGRAVTVVPIGQQWLACQRVVFRPLENRLSGDIGIVGAPGAGPLVENFTALARQLAGPAAGPETEPEQP